MKGVRSGLVPRVQELESRAVYTHCYGHSINLAANDALTSSKLLKDALDMTREVTKLIKYSPRREDPLVLACFACLRAPHTLVR